MNEKEKEGIWAEETNDNALVRLELDWKQTSALFSGLPLNLKPSSQLQQ